MNKSAFFDSIQVDEYSPIPKYIQLINGILDHLEQQQLCIGEFVPSINQLVNHFNISRPTAEKSYRYLKKAGVLNGVRGKGYYVTGSSVNQKLKILLLFNKLSTHKKLIYDSFIKTLGPEAPVDLYVYDNNFSLFKRYLNMESDYSHYVIIPHFIDGYEEEVKTYLERIPKHKLILVDKLVPGLDGEFSAVYENFEANIFDALESALDYFSKYKSFKLIFPKGTYYPREIIKGFYRFCMKHKLKSDLVTSIEREDINCGDLFISILEEDIVSLLERVTDLNYRLGTDVGLISYNETPLKRVILNGISTMSTDFEYIGRVAASFVKSDAKCMVEAPFHFIKRDSV